MPPAALTARYVAFAQALIATAGSLFLSEVAHITPCVLCWWQRICMYPLVVIIGVGIVRGDRKLYQYALPLAVTGWIIGVYHTLLQWHVVSGEVAPCLQGVSCAEAQIHWLGFITIPFMATLAFTIVIIALLTEWRFSHGSRS